MITSRFRITFRQTHGAGTESSDSTLAEGRAALDEVTRKILALTSGRGYTRAGCLPARKIFNSSLAKLETHLSLQTL